MWHTRMSCVSRSHTAEWYKFLRWEVPDSSLPVISDHACMRELFYYDINGKSLATTGVKECESNGYKAPCVSSRKSYDKNQWSHFRAFDGKDVNNAGFCTSRDNKGAGWLRYGGLFTLCDPVSSMCHYPIIAYQRFCVTRYHFAKPVSPKTFKVHSGQGTFN